jgi:serine/threonine protein kinase/tetratricopeptide (TPR) repeat protein
MNDQSPLEAIFFAALEKGSPQERAAYLDEASAGNPDLRRSVEKMLVAQAQAGSFLEQPACSGVMAGDDQPITERPGTIIGPYKLMEQIGEGGMGLVFVAEQQHPVRRKLALKVIKPGMDTRQVIARFEAERQALALMDHPNIAKVHDGGETASGRPYFVMELVKGMPITEYCDQNQLPIRERLELFLPVCQAVQHAHQKGIIHRDIKPSNVLIMSDDGTPLVKVIDFGVAKAIGQQLTDKTIYTQFAQLVGTPLYMSPEQAGHSGRDVDTRTDIYALGVLLYELLTGTTPFEKSRLREADYEEIRRIIREEEPPKPSTRISTLGQASTTVSTQRKSDPKRLGQLFRGELDWIVMKSLEKDRNRRYDTASAFSADVQRYLEDEPVLACPPSASYRLRKFVRRNKGKVTAAAAMLALVLGGAAASTWQAVRATRAEQRANEALTKAAAAQAQAREALDALTDDVVETMFTKQRQLGEKENAFLRKVLGFYEAFTQQSAESAEAAFLRAKSYYTVAHLRALLGEHSDAVTGFREAESLLEQLAAEFPEEAQYRHKLARTEGNVGIELAKLGRQAEAETALRLGINLRTKLADDFPENLGYRLELANNYNDFAFLRELQENYAEAEENYRHGLDLKEKLIVEADDQPRYRLDLSRSLSGLGQLLRKQEKYAESEKVFRQAVNIQEEHIGKGQATAKDRQWLADSYAGLGVALAELKRPPEAENALRQALEVRHKLADDFPSVLEYRRELANATGDLAYFLTRQGKDAAALEPYRQVLELRKAIVKQAGSVPGYRRELAASYHDVAQVLRVTGRLKEAESSWRAALELWSQLAVDLPQVPDCQGGLAGALTNLARLHNQRGKFAAAAALLEKAQTHLQAALDARPKDSGFRQSFRDHLVALAQSRLGLADHTRGAAAAGDLTRFGFESANDTYDAAGFLSRCMTLAEKDVQLAEATRKELARGYSDQALALLRQAVTRGFKDAARMKKDPDFEPLRDREEFRKLLASLEAGSGRK